MKKFPISNFQFPIFSKKRGFTLIEALVLLFIFSLITITFYQVISVGTRYIIFSKNRLGAIALANEKMEIARNLNYDDVGIYGGACAGVIPQDEDIIENGRSYHVHTLATYVDDPYDGALGGSPGDTNYKDYKLLKITVSWNNGENDTGSVFLLSRFVPPGLEAATSGDGILSINIISDQAGGVGVSGATVRITNSDLGFDETRQTDENGNVMLVGAKESINKYRLAISKSGYEAVSTLPPFPDSAYNPTNVHASVLSGVLNVVAIAQNKLADLKISTVDYLGNSISSIDFGLIGGRKLGTEVTFPYNPVYNLNTTGQTNSSGEKQYDDISSGEYNFTLSDSETGYALVRTDPFSPFLLLSEANLDFKVQLANKNMTSILVKIKKSDDDALLAGATVKLTNTLGYDEEIITDENGSAFFPKNDSTPFVFGIYNLKITADGYQDYSEDIEVLENQLKEENIIMLLN